MTQSIEYVVKVGGAAPATAQVKTVEDALARTATQAQRAGGAIDKAVAPTRNLGQAGLEAARAIEDLQYGFNGIVNNIPSLVMGLGAGAGVAGALSLAAVAANQLFKNFGNVGDAGKAAADAAKSHMEALTKSISDADTELQNLVLGATLARITAQKMAVEEAAQAGKEAQATFRQQFGIDPNDQRQMGRIASQAQGGLDVWITRWNAQKQEMEKVRVAARDVMNEYRKVTDAYNIAIDEQVLLRRYEQIEAERIDQLKIDAAVDAANQQTAIEQKTADKKVEIKWDAAQNELDLEEKAANWLAKMREQAIRHRQENERNAAREMERMERDRTRALELEAQERERIREREAQHAMRQANLITGLTISTAAILADGIASAALGQEQAVEQTLAALSRQAGGFITLKGGELLASGIAGTLIAPGNPKSLAELAGGAALVAAGAAVTSGGPAAVSALMGKAGGGSGTASGATRDPGASPRTTSNAGSGGPMIINVSYGAGGPLPEDVAREIHRVVRSGDRRSGR